MMSWEKQPGETKKEYCYFKEFLESDTRTVHKWAEEKKKDPEVKTSISRLRNIASYNKWLSRARDYDNYHYLIKNQEILHLDIQGAKGEFKDLIVISEQIRENIIQFLEEVDVMDSKLSFTLQTLVNSLKTVIELKRLLSEQSTENVNTNLIADVNTNTNLSEFAKVMRESLQDDI